MTRTMQLLLLVGALQLVARGTDLLFSPVSGAIARDMGGAQGAVWGITCLIAAAVVLVGLLLRSPVITVQGSLIGFAVYGMFSWFVLDYTILAYPPDDWRILADHAAKSTFWLIFAVSVSFRHGVHQILVRKGAKDGLGADSNGDL